MGKTILVTGKESFLGNEIAQHPRTRASEPRPFLPPRRKPLTPPTASTVSSHFSWSGAVAGGGQDLILQTIQEFDSLDEAWLVVSPERESYGLADLAPPAHRRQPRHQSRARSTWCVRLLNRHAIPALTLRFVFFDEDPAGLPPLAAVQYHGLRGLGDLAAQPGQESGASPCGPTRRCIPQADEYASYLILAQKCPRRAAGTCSANGSNLVNSLFSRKENA